MTNVNGINSDRSAFLLRSLEIGLFVGCLSLTILGAIRNDLWGYYNSLTKLFAGLGGFYLGWDLLAEGRHQARMRKEEAARRSDRDALRRSVEELRLHSVEALKQHSASVLTDCDLFNSALRLNALPPGNEVSVRAWIVQARVKSVNDLEEIAKITAKLAQSDGTINDAAATPRETLPIFLYTSFESGLNPAVAEELKCVIEEINSRVVGSWYYSPIPSSPWKFLVWHPNGCLLCDDSPAQNWLSLEFTSVLRDALNKTVEQLVKRDLPLLVNARQVLHASAINPEINRAQLDDIASAGFHFGKHAQLLTEYPKAMLSSASHAAYQQTEDRNFTEFMEDILFDECEVISFWPLLDSSLQYIYSPVIGRWQALLAEAVRRSDRPVSATRYLLVRSRFVNGEIKAVEDCVNIPLRCNNRIITKQLRYDLLVEILIGAVFWDSLSLPNFDLIIIPIDNADFRRAQGFFGDRLQEQMNGDCGPKEVGAVLKGLGIDWVMITSKSGQRRSTILQFDQKIQITKCAAPHLGLREVASPSETSTDTYCCPIARDYAKAELLVHRYAIVNTGADARPDGRGECRGHAEIVARFGYLRDVLKYTMSRNLADLSTPRSFKQRSVLTNIYDRLCNEAPSGRYRAKDLSELLAECGVSARAGRGAN